MRLRTSNVVALSIASSLLVVSGCSTDADIAKTQTASGGAGGGSAGGASGASGSQAAAGSGGGGAAGSGGANGGQGGVVDATCGVSPPVAASCKDDPVKKAAVLASPIVPPASFGGTSVFAPDGTANARLDDELCGAGQADGSVFLNYSVATHRVNSVWFQPGYEGAWTTQSRPGSVFSKDGIHTYVVRLGQLMTRDGVPVTLPWLAPTTPGNLFDELYDAALWTNAPSLSPMQGVVSADPLVSCAAVGACVVGKFSDETRYLYPPALGTGLTFDPANDAVVNIQLYVHRIFGFSPATVHLKVDDEGPVATLASPGVSTGTCHIALGTSVSDVLANCVMVTGDAAKDAAERDRLLTTVSDDERHIVLASGLGLELRPAGLSGTDVLAPGAKPSPDDTVTAFTIDGTTALENDREGADVAALPKGHGAALVFVESMRLVQAALQSYRTDVCADAKSCAVGLAPIRRLGDPDCIDHKDAQGCTGLEGVVGSPFALGAPDPDDPYLAGVIDPKFEQARALFNSEFQPCFREKNALGAVALKCPMLSPWERVRDVLGKGDVNALPAEARDSAFFVRHAFAALAKYLAAAAKSDETASGVHSQPFDVDQLSATQDDVGHTLRYVVRDGPNPRVIAGRYQLGAWLTPMSVTVSSFRTRGENGVYEAMLDHTVPGASFAGIGDDVRFSNVVGSRLLSSLYATSPDCAVQASASCVVGPPRAPDGTIALDGGQPLLTGYRGAIFANGVLSLGEHGTRVVSETPCPRPHATIQIPSREQPFVATPLFSPMPITAVVPWASPMDGGGFSVPDATGVAHAIADNSVDLGGTGFSYRASYVTADGATSIRAVQAQAFGGRVFLCHDAANGSLLSVRGFDAAAVVREWMAAHAAAATACGMIENTADKTISARAWGVTLSLGDADRVAGALVWDAK